MDSTLSLKIADLALEVGSFLGYGRTPANWTGWDALHPYVPAQITVSGRTLSGDDSQLGHIVSCLNSGLRNFYNPMLTSAPNDVVAHKWSFLTPEANLSVLASDNDYDLPDIFASMEGDMTFQPTDNVWHTVRRSGIGEVRAMLQKSDSLTGWPLIVAVYPKSSDGVLGQRFGALFFPTPDQNYTLTYRFNLQPNALTAANPYPLGGARHAETLLESCLAVAEARFQDEMTTHRTRFQECLQASISIDDRDFKPEYLGRNRDRSVYPAGRSWRGHDLDSDIVHYNLASGTYP